MKANETITIKLDARTLLKGIRITKAEVAVAQAQADVLLETLEECKRVADSLPPLLPKFYVQRPWQPKRRRKNPA